MANLAKVKWGAKVGGLLQHVTYEAMVWQYTTYSLFQLLPIQYRFIPQSGHYLSICQRAVRSGPCFYIKKVGGGEADKAVLKKVQKKTLAVKSNKKLY